MTVHAETRVIPHRPEELYALVADVRRYPEFLPWCMAIRSQQQQVLLTREFYVLLLWRSSPQQLYMWLLKYTRQLHRQMNITTS